jgi:hypothetical protein
LAKPGDAYQEAVAEVFRIFYPTALIEVGDWIEGPDGRRDCDVGVRFVTPDGTQRFLLIECKDWKSRVGIEVVDALESKRRDVEANIAIICSNSGYTSNALRKASRTGIIMLSALRERDSRIRVQVEEEIYTRRINISGYNTSFRPFNTELSDDTKSGVTMADVRHDGRLVAAWVRDKCILLAAMAARSSKIVAKYTFSRPLQFHFKQEIVPVKLIILTIPCQVQWHSQIIGISASAGMYEYLRHRVVMGKGTHQYYLKGVDPKKWSPIDFVPDQVVLESNPGPNELKFTLSLLSGLWTVDDAPAPDLDRRIDSVEIERSDLGSETSIKTLDKRSQKEETLNSQKLLDHYSELVKGPDAIIRRK